MLIKNSSAEKFENSANCTVFEYNFPSKNMSFATAKINGRYPEVGNSIHTSCEQVYFVISGSGTIHSECGNFEISAKDLYRFKINEPYWIEGSDLFVAIVNSPKWTKKQYKNIK